MMENTIYINHYFTPKNQQSYYRSMIDEFVLKQEENMKLIFNKLNKQHTYISNSMYVMSKMYEQYSDLRDEMKDLQTNTDKNIHLLNSNQRLLLEILDMLDNFSTSALPLLKESLSSLTNNFEKSLTYVKSIEKQLNDLKEIGNVITHHQHDMKKKCEDMETNLANQLDKKLNETQNNITNNILFNFNKLKEELDKYFEQLTNQSMCELFQELNPGTKVNYIVVSGLEIKLVTFINYEKTTNQVKFVRNDGNLFITTCSNIEAIELRTKKQSEE